jgi:ABC-type nitrate/sulfonate/bicarbonate transport system ATPase subunit
MAELSAPSPAMTAAVPAEAPGAWRGLDVVLAHAALLTGVWGRAEDPASVLVAHDVDEALRLADERGGVAVLLRSPSPSDVAAVARAGARMPRKSTLFVPKPRTGLVLRPHAD